MKTHDSFAALPKVNSFASLPSAFYTRLNTKPLTDTALLHVNREVARMLALSDVALASDEFLSVVSGTAAMDGGATLSAVYSGHQFGVWAGQLGDGRAHLLAGVGHPDNELEIQLKGAGSTHYSRMGDGRAVLRYSVREYLASEAMHGLGIPTTRALALATSTQPVIRETIESAAVVTRVAPSFIRFGSFEHWSSRKQPGELKILADYVIDRFYPDCRDSTESAKPGQVYVELLRRVALKTAELMASWQVVGFCHGVMNTDNMSIIGLTLDYGPFGFMDGFDARHICNHTDTNGRYSWHAQPAVANWNLFQLANSLYDLVPDAERLQGALAEFEPRFLSAMQTKMMRKLGLSEWLAGDEGLVDELWSLMHANKADFTLTFRQLAHAPGLSGATYEQISIDLGGTTSLTLQPFIDLFVDRDAASAWLRRYQERIQRQSTPWQERVSGMLATNPLYVLRNHLAQQAIDAAKQGDSSEIERLMALLNKPYNGVQGMESYSSLPPAWASTLEVSCSS